MTADIHALDSGRVLKLFKAGRPASSVDREYDISRKVHEAGVAAPAVYDIATVGDRRGIIYERAGGSPMADWQLALPWELVRRARLLARLQANLHAVTVSGLPSQRAELERKIRAAHLTSEPQKETALRLLHGLPDGNILCHGDFHPANVILGRNGPLIIDWADATSGHPLADVARTSLLLRHGSLHSRPGIRRVAIRWIATLFHRFYLRRYLRLTGADASDIEKWHTVIAAARLNEGIIAEEKQLLSIVSAGGSH